MKFIFRPMFMMWRLDLAFRIICPKLRLQTLHSDDLQREIKGERTMHTELNKRKSALTHFFRALCVLICFGLAGAVTAESSFAKGKKRRKQANRLDRRMKRSQYGLFGLRVHGNFATLSTTRDTDPFVRDPSRGSSVGFGITFDKGLNDVMSLRLDALYLLRHTSF